MGSSGSRQIDGLGGGDPLISRAYFITPSCDKNFDIDFRFALVHINSSKVDFEGVCGNLISAAAPFAINEGLVAASELVAHVRILDGNSGVHTNAQAAQVEGSVVHSLVQGMEQTLMLHHSVGTMEVIATDQGIGLIRTASLFIRGAALTSETG